MNLTPNTTLTLKLGTRIRLGDLFNRGGEGAVYRAKILKSGEAAVYKVLQNPTPQKIERTRILVEARHGEQSELFCAPMDYQVNGHVGHLSPLAPGVSLEQYLETPGALYPDTLVLAVAYAHAHALLNERDWAQADLSLGNCHVEVTPARLGLRLLDFDNFTAPGAPPPGAYGQEDRMAPELRQACKLGQPAQPDELSDRFALATILHDMLLAKSVASGFDQTPETLERALSGGWPHDPLYGKGPADAGGYPSAILNSELAALFRRGLGVNREDRPPAKEWREALARNVRQLWVDPRCQGPSFIDPGRTACPLCGRPFPMVRLVFPSLPKTVVCDTASLSLGRDQLRSPKVSALHAVVRRQGPETRIITHGGNGTYWWDGNAWKRLVEEAVLQPGQRWRLADVECVVEEVG